MNNVRIPKWAFAAIIGIGFVASCINHAHAAAPKYNSAPVVEPSNDEGIMLQTGWYRYAAQPDAFVLYCVKTGAVSLVCAVYVAAKDANAVVLIEATATQGAT